MKPDDLRIVSGALARQIASADDCEACVNELAYISEVRKTLERERKKIVDPLNASVKATNDRFRVPREKLDGAITHLKKHIAAWHELLEARALKAKKESEAEQRRLAAAAESEEASVKAEAHGSAKALGLSDEQAAFAAEAASTEVPLVPATVVTPDAPAKRHSGALGTATVTKRWTFEVENENEVPRAFLVVNEKAIRAAVKAGTRSIPGVRIFQAANVRRG
jgi:hypothetical protein